MTTRPDVSWGPHTDADRVHCCTFCRFEYEPAPDALSDDCPDCLAEGSIIAVWGEFQLARFRTGERVPEDWEDGPQPARPADK